VASALGVHLRGLSNARPAIGWVTKNYYLELVRFGPLSLNTFTFVIIHLSALGLRGRLGSLFFCFSVLLKGLEEFDLRKDEWTV
jgi:hypothetical protein